MFQIDDKVVYGIMGVCTVYDINTPPIKGVNGNFYFLQPVFDNRGLIYSPIENKVPIRAIISKEEAVQLMDMAKECDKVKLLNERISPTLYETVIKSQDTLKMLHLIRDLYNIKNERAKELRKMKTHDSRVFASVKKLLYGEISVALEEDFENVSKIMDSYLSI